MTDITRKCLILERKQKEQLIKILQESLVEPTKHHGKRFQVLLNIAEEMFGKGILSGSRSFNLVLGRRFITWKMREEGFSWSEIGRSLVKHHASVIHMWKAMAEIFEYPYIFKLEMAYWAEFDSKVKEYDIQRGAVQGS